MPVKEKTRWITGEEFGEERRRLLLAGFRDDSPEMQRLWKLVEERNEYLWKRYAEPLIDSHRGEWAAVSMDGEIIFAETGSEVQATARDKFGPASFVYGRMAEFRGRKLGRW